MAFVEDLTAFLNTDEFATAATYNGSTTINGIFDKEFFGADAGGMVAIEASKPVFHCRAADVATDAVGKTLVVSGTTYTIEGQEPDGTGMTKLILRQ